MRRDSPGTPGVGERRDLSVSRWWESSAATNLPVCFREFVHLHAGEEFHGETHGGVVLEAGCHGAQGDGGVLAEVGLHGDVGAAALGHGRGGLDEEGVAEVGPLVPAEGALKEELGEVVDFAAGEDAPDAGFLKAGEEGGGGRALWRGMMPGILMALPVCPPLGKSLSEVRLGIITVSELKHKVTSPCRQSRV